MSPEDVLLNAVAAAVMAPSSHNTQPWRFRIRGNTLDLFVDRARHLRVIDPDQRQLLQSCGCALFNARVAVRAMGYTDEVMVTIVDDEPPEHVASLTLGPPRLASEADQTLMAAVGRRATNRRSFLARPVSQEHADLLAEAAAREGVMFARLDPEQKRDLGRLVAAADEMLFDDPEYRDELARWLRPVGSVRRDGIPFAEKEFGTANPFLMTKTLRSRVLGDAFGQIEASNVEHAPLVAVLGTPDDDPASWLFCGEAIESVLLHATSLGYSAAFLNQVLEIPMLRDLVSLLVPEIGNPQMILRIGVPSEPITKRAPRRKLAHVVEIERPRPPSTVVS